MIAGEGMTIRDRDHSSWLLALSSLAPGSTQVLSPSRFKSRVALFCTRASLCARSSGSLFCPQVRLSFTALSCFSPTRCPHCSLFSHPHLLVAPSPVSLGLSILGLSLATLSFPFSVWLFPRLLGFKFATLSVSPLSLSLRVSLSHARFVDSS